MQRYTTYGSVRGTCGHAHLTIVGAVWCLMWDRIACRRLRAGKSDRDPMIITDGRKRDLTPHERREFDRRMALWKGASNDTGE